MDMQIYKTSKSRIIIVFDKFIISLIFQIEVITGVFLLSSQVSFQQIIILQKLKYVE